MSDQTAAPAGAIDHDQLYAALKRLHHVCAAAADSVVSGLRSDRAGEFTAALAQAHALLYPPPPPEAPEGATVLYAYAVRPGDGLYTGAGFKEVTGIAGTVHGTLEFTLGHPDAEERHRLRADELVVVLRHAADPDAEVASC